MALNNPALLADLAIGVLLICAAAIKAHKGLYRSLMPLAVFAASVVCAIILSSVLTQPLSARIVPKVTESLASKLSTHGILTDTVDGALDAMEKALPTGMLDALDTAGVSQKAHMLAQEAGTSAENTADRAVYAAAEALAESLVPRYVKLFLLVALFVLFRIVLSLLAKSFGLVFKLPVVGSVDKLGGAALGVIEGATVIWGVLWLSRQLGITRFSDMAEGTLLLSLFT